MLLTFSNIRSSLVENHTQKSSLIKEEFLYIFSVVFYWIFYFYHLVVWLEYLQIFGLRNFSILLEFYLTFEGRVLVDSFNFLLIWSLHKTLPSNTLPSKITWLFTHDRPVISFTFLNRSLINPSHAKLITNPVIQLLAHTSIG